MTASSVRHFEAGTGPCACVGVHTPQRIVLTGGPGAGKSAVLELVRRSFCEHLLMVPEAASVVFGGGFPREDGPACRRAAQQAIFHVQHALEACAAAHHPAVLLCDRGTVDGVAYWPGPDTFWTAMHTSRDRELARYDVVIHLRSPRQTDGYNHANPLRTESAATAAVLDDAILDAWARHPRRLVVPAGPDFMVKATKAVELIRAQLPTCCAQHLTVETSRTSPPRE